MPTPRLRGISHGRTVRVTKAPVAGMSGGAGDQIIGGKWKMLVLRSLLLNGPQHYNQLLVSVSDISPKELTRNLRELTGAGLVRRGPVARRRICSRRWARG